MANTYETTTGRETRLHGSMDLVVDFEKYTLADHKLILRQILDSLRGKLEKDLEDLHTRIAGRTSR